MNTTSSGINSGKAPELLCPGGDFDKARSALLYGADSVYVGGKSMNLRASARGVDKSELALLVKEAEAAGAKIYYCLNSLPLERDLPELPAQIEEAAQSGAHALIVADPGLLALARRYAPGVPLHLSTQANNTNSEAVNFWFDHGVERAGVLSGALNMNS